MSEMEDKGYEVTFSNGNVHIWKNNFKYAFTLRFSFDSLYQDDGSSLGVMSYDTSLQSKCWHRRFGPLYYKAIHYVKQMVTGMPKLRIEKEGVCWGCAKGKIRRGLFPSNQSKTSNILQLVHSDISEAGIKRETTTPYTPEWNGVAKRKNRTITEAARAMLHDQRLPKFLWAEAANTAIYVKKWMPSSSIGFQDS